VPGARFQSEIEKAISVVNAAIICIGKADLGQWQEIESQIFISLNISKGVRLIPVLLPGVEDIPANAPLLKQFHFVKFDETIDNEYALDLLEWGITQKKPVRLEAVISNKSEDFDLKPPITSIHNYNPSKILFIKNVKDPSGRWAYRLTGVKDNQEPVFELMWRLSSHGVSLPKTGDLMLLHQQARVTHVTEFLDEQIRKTDFGYLRLVKVAWMPTQQDWYKIPHQKEILGFSPRYSDGNTHDLRSPNFLTFRNAWERLSDFQLHVVERLQEIDLRKNARSY
jgi:hypothetical protein